MKKKFKISIVGCGDISRYEALGCRLNRHIKMDSCVDIIEEQASAFAKKHKIEQHCTDYDDVFEMSDLDAVYLAVPHNLHFDMIKKAIDRGVHVLCEKPITITIDHALEICRLSKEKGIKVGVNYQYRYDKSCYAMAQACRNGKMGKFYYGRCNIPWHRDDDYFNIGKWRSMKETAGGGTMLTQGSHALDVALWSSGSMPVAAQGIISKQKFKDIEVEDLCMGIIEMDDGSCVQVSSSMITNKEQPVSIELYGSEATAIYKGFDSSKVKFIGKKIKKQKPPTRGLHALFRTLEGFRKWVLDDELFLIPVEQSVSVLAAIDAIYKSAESGKKEMVDQRFKEYI